MAPLASPPGCGSCLHLSQRIAELEGRISTLHQIKENELHIDSMVALATSRLTDNDTTLPWLGTTTVGEPVTIKALPVPLEDPWPSLGARPKKLSCSSPFASEPWITAWGNKHRRRRSPGASTPTSQGQRKGRRSLPLAPVEVLHLSNKFNALEQLSTSQPTQPAPPAGFPDASAAFLEAVVVGPGTAPAPVSTVCPCGSSWVFTQPIHNQIWHPQSSRSRICCDFEEEGRRHRIAFKTHFICLALGLLSMKQMERNCIISRVERLSAAYLSLGSFHSFSLFSPPMRDSIREAWPPWHVIYPDWLVLSARFLVQPSCGQVKIVQYIYVWSCSLVAMWGYYSLLLYVLLFS